MQACQAGREVVILGTRGLPARHSGFESFVEYLAPYLAERGWHVTVACQEDRGAQRCQAEWRGVVLDHFPTRLGGSAGSILFDAKSAVASGSPRALILTFGYNTAVLGIVHRLRGRRHIVNMDGLEWKRQKWSRPVRAWFYLNEQLARLLADHLIADHPEIERHLARRTHPDKITMIPYGADRVTDADPDVLAPLGLAPQHYAVVIARAEPENSILEIVSAFSCRRRGYRLAILGTYEPKRNRYHRAVIDAASDEVAFLGPIYERRLVQSLRYFARLYVHGHQVGGTNPSLVEALGAGNAVLARDNPFNRWVAGEHMAYFGDAEQCAVAFDRLLEDAEWLERARRMAVARHAAAFTWEIVLRQYEELLQANSFASRRVAAA